VNCFKPPVEFSFAGGFFGLNPVAMPVNSAGRNQGDEFREKQLAPVGTSLYFLRP
jgi:hypothetical protein